MRERHVVVVGAGMGGLVSALLLAHQGVRVTVIERGLLPGGKVRQLQVDGAAIDSGPTVFTMRWVFDELFASVGTSMDQLLKLQTLDVLARHAWADGKHLDLFADVQASTDAIGRFAGLAEARNFERFCLKTREVYDTLQAPYIQTTLPSVMQFTKVLGARGLATLASLGVMSSLWESLGRYFQNDKLRQLFARYATYCGSSPWQAPATLMLIAQVEMDGVWTIEGGMHALPQCLEKLAKARGAKFQYGQSVQRIHTAQNKVCGVSLTNGEVIEADAVVFNGDVSPCMQACWGQQQPKPHREATANALCRQSLGPSMPKHPALNWTGTMFSFKTTTPLSSKIFLKNNNCPAHPRCMCAPKTEAQAASPRAANVCCVW